MLGESGASVKNCIWSVELTQRREQNDCLRASTLLFRRTRIVSARSPGLLVHRTSRKAELFCKNSMVHAAAAATAACATIARYCGLLLKFAMQSQDVSRS
jgi:hypothetical protein